MKANTHILDRLLKRVEVLEEKVKVLRKEKTAFSKGYNLLMDYWDSLPDDDKPKLDKKLKRLGI